jgi:hypothetical protein
MEGELDGVKILVQYRTWGFDIATQLDAPHDEVASNGEALAEMAMNDAKLPMEERTVEVLDEGGILEESRRKKRPQPVQSVEIGRKRARRVREIEGKSSWYTFCAPKEDEALYGRCHDLFTEMYLTHGLPYDMALWTTSNFATDENVFFAEIPAGLDVKNDDFFRELPFAACPPPSRTGLLKLVGHFEESDEPQAPVFARKRRRLWGLSKAA